MSKPGTIYELQVQNCEKLADQETFNEQLIVIKISDTDHQIDDLDEATVILMDGTETPVEFSTIDNSEDVFTVIKATQLTMRVLTSNSVSMSTFAGGSAQRWAVDAYRTGTDIMFKGFLVVADMSESFMPHPRELELVANDGLGLLKDIPLTDFAGDNPTGYNNIASYLTWALSKTGLALNMRVVNNITPGAGEAVIPNVIFGTYDGVKQMRTPDTYENFFYIGQKINVTGTFSNNATFTVVSFSSSTGTTFVVIEETPTPEWAISATLTDDLSTKHLYQGCFLEAKTFEDEINVSEDCYTVIEKILGESCQLFQRNGEWWVVRINEYETGSFYVSTFNTTAQLGEHFAPYAFNKEIGKDSYVVYFSQEATRVRTEMAHKELKLIYNYQRPIEIICNIDFSRGDFIENLPDEDIEGTYYAAASYTLECSTKISKKNTGIPLNGETATAEIEYFVEKIYNDTSRTYERERFIVVRRLTDANYYDFTEFVKMTGGIIVNVKDKIIISIDYRFKETPFAATGRFPIMYIKLYSDDGTVYAGYPSNIPQFWFNEATHYASYCYADVDPSTTDYTKFQTYTIEIPSVIKPGIIYIHFGCPADEFFGPSPTFKDIIYSNLNIDYYALINGSYKQYNGQQHLITQDLENKIRRERDVYISDSPNKLFKGALHYFSDPGYSLINKFFDGHLYPTGSPEMDDIKPYGEIQAFDVWNQIRNDMRLFDAQCQGLDSGGTDVLSGVNMVSLLHKFVLQDVTPHTTARRFKMLTNSIIWDKAEWQGVLREVYNIIKGKNYTGHSFKYLS